MHRNAVLALLSAHASGALSREEASAVRETVELVTAHPDCLLRSCLPGHVTGSAWIVSPDRSQTLLTLHRKLGKWLQLGGHADGDPNLLAVAMREAVEESGLRSLRAVRPSVPYRGRPGRAAHRVERVQGPCLGAGARRRRAQPLGVDGADGPQDPRAGLAQIIPENWNRRGP